MMKEENWFDGASTGGGGDVTIDVGGVGQLHGRGGMGSRSSSGSTTTSMPSASSSSSSSSLPLGGLENKIAYEVAGQMLRQAQTQAGGFLNIYANLDLIKPYFDVELATVIRRIKMSFIPRGLKMGGAVLPSSMSEADQQQPDLYGPTMLAFTLVAILLLGMKLSHKTVEEGTLMGSAFGVCFSYWVVASLGMRFAGYLFGMSLTMLEALSLAGYGLGGYCASLVLHYLFHPISGVFSTVALVVFGGASAVTLASVFWSDIHQRDPMKASIAAISVGSIHFLFLLYIRFFYASLYNAAAAAF